MTEYTIERFDAVMISGKIASPMIYIKQDPELLEFFNKNKNVVGCEINGTKTYHDGGIIPGIVNTHSFGRPIFFRDSGLVAITLLTEFRSYPEYGSNGTVKFSGVE